MISARYFRWLPNALTISRVLLAVLVFLAAMREAWVVSLWFLAAALLTDFFDGLVAKKLHAQTRLGAEIDALADSSLVAAGFAGLTAAGLFPLWATVVVLAAGVVIGKEDWFFPPRTKMQRGIRKLGMVGCLFVAWTFIVWVYAAQVFSWSWLYIPATLVVLAVLARLKRHRIKAWSRGQS